MDALTALCTGMFFVSGDRCRRVAFQFYRRRKEVGTPVKPSPLPLPLLRHSLCFPKGRRGGLRGRGGEVWAEEELAGRYDLESEIYEFMVKSENPMGFPSKEELIAAGREDLAIAIAKERGWMAYGWDLDEEGNEEDSSGVSGLTYEDPCEEDSITSPQTTPSVAIEADACLNADSNNLLACSEDSSVPSSSSWRAMEADPSEDAGIEGMLIRLEKERSLAFGFLSHKDKERKFVKEKTLPDMAAGNGCDNTVRSFQSTGRFISSILKEKGDPSLPNNTSTSHRTWRAWSNRKSGDPLAYFEAGEIVSSSEDKRKSDLRTSGSYCLYDFNPESITSALHQLRVKTASGVPYKDQQSLMMELRKLSDALEFQQNEIMNARDMLRSTKAKLAAMEGKVSLEATENQRLLEEKQRRLDAAQRTLFVLRTVCITWSNSASQVLLVGSFDGWASQRRMEKTSTRMFTLYLKLYPGRYEIKFIVDGVWAVDPLRPVVRNNGFENNLLVVS